MTEPVASPRSPGRRLVAALLLLILVAVPYAQTASFEFVSLDDGLYVVNNPMVRQGFEAATLRQAFTQAYAMNWHPLTWLSHMLDFRLFELDAGGHHLTSVALHALAALFLFLALLRLTGHGIASWFVAALFAIHPQRVESVAWVSERKDVLSALFFALTLWAYGAAVREGTRGRRLLVIAFLALGLMAKPMLVTTPFVLLLIDVWPLGRHRSVSLGRRVLEKWPLFLMAAAACVLTVWAQRAGGAVRSLEALPLEWRLVNAPLAYVAYLVKAAGPVGLACFYPHPGLLADPVDARTVWQSMLALAALGALTLLALRRAGPAATGWLWYLGMLVPVIGIAQVGEQARADRYTYLPMIGIELLVVFGVQRWAAARPGRQRVAVGAGALVLLILLPLTYRQAATWHDSKRLYEHALEVTHDNYLAHYNLGHALQMEHADDAAMEHYRRVLELRPAYGKAHSNLGTLLAQRGQVGQALEHFQQAVAANPEHANSRLNLGQALEGKGRLPEAREQFERALALKPDLAEARVALERVRRRMGQ